MKSDRRKRSWDTHLQELEQWPKILKPYQVFMFEFFPYSVYTREINSTFDGYKLLLVCFSSPVIPSLSYFIIPDKLMSWPDRGAASGWADTACKPPVGHYLHRCRYAIKMVLTKSNWRCLLPDASYPLWKIFTGWSCSVYQTDNPSL